LTAEGLIRDPRRERFFRKSRLIFPVISQGFCRASKSIKPVIEIGGEWVRKGHRGQLKQRNVGPGLQINGSIEVKDCGHIPSGRKPQPAGPLVL
jgi:hypothetical protein